MLEFTADFSRRCDSRRTVPSPNAYADGLTEELVGGAELEAGAPGVLVWRKGGEFATAVATLPSFEPIPKVPCPVTAECIRCDSKSQVLRGDVGDSPPRYASETASVPRVRRPAARPRPVPGLHIAAALLLLDLSVIPVLCPQRPIVIA